MSLTKLLKAPIKLFKKDVISFLIIHRHDLAILEDKLRYIAVKPTASISVLRQKVWHLLELPDYCEEIIILKSHKNVEMPLTELRKGNDPTQPFYLEVWSPASGKQLPLTAVPNMITMGCEDDCFHSNATSSIGNCAENVHMDCTSKSINSPSMGSNETMALNKLRIVDNNKKMGSFIPSDYKKSDVTCRISSTSLLFKLQGRKSRENFTNILLKIQNDLSVLSNKLSSLENRISN